MYNHRNNNWPILFQSLNNVSSATLRPYNPDSTPRIDSYRISMANLEGKHQYYILLFFPLDVYCRPIFQVELRAVIACKSGRKNDGDGEREKASIYLANGASWVGCVCASTYFPSRFYPRRWNFRPGHDDLRARNLWRICRRRRCRKHRYFLPPFAISPSVLRGFLSVYLTLFSFASAHILTFSHIYIYTYITHICFTCMTNISFSRIFSLRLSYFSVCF